MVNSTTSQSFIDAENLLTYYMFYSFVHFFKVLVSILDLRRECILNGTPVHHETSVLNRTAEIHQVAFLSDTISLVKVEDA